MRTLRTVAPLAFVLGLGGCGSGSPPTPTPTGLTIVGPEGVMFLGQIYSFTASLQLSNGTSNTVSGNWGSDALSVAVAQTTTGQVNVVGIGEATIFVDAQGLRATKRIRTTVNYQGRLEGGFRQTSCSQSGVFATGNVCGDFPNGTLFGFTGTFTQTGENVVATMDLIEFPADPVNATVNGAGELRFTTEHREENLTAIAQWVLRPSGTTFVDGTATWRIRAIGLSGTWEIKGTILPAPIARSLEPSSAAGTRAVKEALRFLDR
jgi:hypothetical protein